MTAGTHLAGAVLTAAILRGSGLELGFPEAVVCLLGSLLADIDTTSSGVGKFARPLSSLLETRFGHRTLTHSLLGCLLLGVLLWPLERVQLSLYWALLCGHLSHLLLDTFNVNGVPLLWPARAQFWFFPARSLRIKYGSPAGSMPTPLRCAPARPVDASGGGAGFEPRWSDLIHDEWIRNVRVNRPDLPFEQLERSCRLMDLHALEAKVTGFEHRIPTLELPDPDDRHVLAAALHAGVGVIVTFNLRDFPHGVLAPLGVLAQHPDPFTLALLETNPNAVLEALAQQRRALTRPPLIAKQLLTLLERQGLERTVAALRPHLERI